MSSQPNEAKRGEIAFRRLLVQQQVEGRTVLADEYDSEGIQAVLAERMATTVAQMSALRERGVQLSPYLELGAERGQRALALENDLGLTGAAVDLSLDMLRSCRHWAEVFERTRLPLRICCDANRLPFRSESLPFVFCYEFLHHFPDPAPLVAEAFRVLAPGGYFYFAEEPVRRRLHLGLYRAPKLHSTTSRRASRLRRLVDSFCAVRQCNETAWGIIENDAIPLSSWRRALRPFAEREATTRTLRGLQVPLEGAAVWAWALAELFGGEIRGLCRKSGELPEVSSPVTDCLVCPRCLSEGVEQRLVAEEFACPACRTTYPVVHDVLMLFEPAALAELYPELGDRLPQP